MSGPESESHDIPAEQAVLGSMIQSRDAIGECLDIVRAADFYPTHQVVFLAMASMAAEGLPVDAITLDKRLQGQKLPYGGAPYLHTLMASVPSVANAAYYARQVRDQAARRDLDAAGSQIRSVAVSRGLDEAERAEQAGRILDSAVSRDTAPAAAMVGELLPAYLERLEHGDSSAPPVATGLVDFDELFAGGLRPGELVTVGARPGVGKTAYLVTVALHAATNGVPVVFWSLEMSKDEITERLVSNASGVSLHQLRAQQQEPDLLTEPEWKRIEAAHKRLAGLPLYIDDSPYLKLHDLRGQLRRMRRRGEPAGLALLDYLQLMTGDGKAESRQLEVAALARGLKLMAKEFAVPVVAASQLNRAAEARRDKQPMLSDLRESGAVEQDSDAVILLYREDAYCRESPRAGEIDLIVAKNRHGPQATLTAAFQGHYSRVADMAAG